MKLIIDVPEYIYKLCQGHEDVVYKYIANGKPLPKSYEKPNSYPDGVKDNMSYKPETVTEFADRCRECGAKYGKMFDQKTGHWIIMHDGKYSCDRCNCESPNNEKWDYCPICGAIMVKPQESEEVINGDYK